MAEEFRGIRDGLTEEVALETEPSMKRGWGLYCAQVIGVERIMGRKERKWNRK